MRAQLVGLRIRLWLACGVGVVIVGPPGSGKSFLLERIFPGRLIAPDLATLMATGIRPPLAVSNLPHGHVAIDELNCFERSSVEWGLLELRQRPVVFALQTPQLIQELNIHSAFEGRLAVLFLGSRKYWQDRNWQ
jgi:ABC-type polar amino acid transport system ATPase subunit